MTSVLLSEDIKEIEACAFTGCSSLSEIVVPKGIERIANNAFDQCVSLESIEVDDANREFRSVDGVLFSKDGKTLLKCPQGIKTDVYVVPAEVETIAGDAFKNCANLKSVDVAEKNARVRAIFSRLRAEIKEQPDKIEPVIFLFLLS